MNKTLLFCLAVFAAQSAYASLEASKEKALPSVLTSLAGEKAFAAEEEPLQSTILKIPPKESERQLLDLPELKSVFTNGGAAKESTEKAKQLEKAKPSEEKKPAQKPAVEKKAEEAKPKEVKEKAAAKSPAAPKTEPKKVEKPLGAAKTETKKAEKPAVKSEVSPKKVQAPKAKPKEEPKKLEKAAAKPVKSAAKSAKTSAGKQKAAPKQVKESAAKPKTAPVLTIEKGPKAKGRIQHVIQPKKADRQELSLIDQEKIKRCVAKWLKFDPVKPLQKGEAVGLWEVRFNKAGVMLEPVKVKGSGSELFDRSVYSAFRFCNMEQKLGSMPPQSRTLIVFDAYESRSEN